MKYVKRRKESKRLREKLDRHPMRRTFFYELIDHAKAINFPVEFLNITGCDPNSGRPVTFLGGKLHIMKPVADKIELIPLASEQTEPR